MKPTHYLTVPACYCNEADPSETVTVPAGVAVTFDGKAPGGMARIFLPPLVIGGGLRPLPMIVVPFNAIEAL